MANSSGQGRKGVRGDTLDAGLERDYRRHCLVRGVGREQIGLCLALVFILGVIVVRDLGGQPVFDPPGMMAVRVGIALVLVGLLYLIQFRTRTYLRHHDVIFGGSLLLLTSGYAALRLLALEPDPAVAGVYVMSVAVMLWLLLAFGTVSTRWLILIATPLNAVAIGSIAMLNTREAVLLGLPTVLANLAGVACWAETRRWRRESFLQQRALRAANRRLDERQRQLRQALADQAQWASFVAHDLRQPLFGIAAHTSTLSRELQGSDGDRIASSLRSLSDCVAYMQSSVDRLMALVSLERAKGSRDIGPVPLHNVLNGAMSIFDGVAESTGVQLHFSVEKGAATAVVITDVTALIDIVGNLLDNGIKYRRRLVAGRGAWVLLGAVRLRDSVRIDVVDNGQGIAMADLQRIFEPRWRRPGAGNDGMPPGSGLGLASVAFEIARLDGHRITVRSREGRGSRFCVYVPRIDQSGRLAKT